MVFRGPIPVLAGYSRARLWRYDPGRKKSVLFWQGNQQVGGFGFAKGGVLTLCTDRGVYLLPLSSPEDVSGELQPLFDIPLNRDERFNDIIVDSAGRVFVGTLRSTAGNGTLYRLEKGRSPAVVLEGIGASNGMAFSMD